MRLLRNKRIIQKRLSLLLNQLSLDTTYSGMRDTFIHLFKQAEQDGINHHVLFHSLLSDEGFITNLSKTGASALNAFLNETEHDRQDQGAFNCVLPNAIRDSLLEKNWIRFERLIAIHQAGKGLNAYWHTRESHVQESLRIWIRQTHDFESIKQFVRINLDEQLVSDNAEFNKCYIEASRVGHELPTRPEEALPFLLYPSLRALFLMADKGDYPNALSGISQIFNNDQLSHAALHPSIFHEFIEHFSVRKAPKKYQKDIMQTIEIVDKKICEVISLRQSFINWVENSGRDINEEIFHNNGFKQLAKRIFMLSKRPPAKDNYFLECEKRYGKIDHQSLCMNFHYVSQYIKRPNDRSTVDLTPFLVYALENDIPLNFSRQKNYEINSFFVNSIKQFDQWQALYDKHEANSDKQSMLLDALEGMIRSAELILSNSANTFEGAKSVENLYYLLPQYINPEILASLNTYKRGTLELDLSL